VTVRVPGQQGPLAAPRGRRRWFVVGVYAAIVVVGAVCHEPWRDEVVPLSIARQAGSLAELAAPLRYEGHPILWYLVLWIGWAIVGQTWVLKAASVGCAVAAMVLLNRSPLPRWIRWPFTFSFFPLYQYSVVSRGYGLEMLLLFALCALHPERYRRPVALALVLAALANTELFGFVMAVAFVLMLVVEAMLGASHWTRRATVARRAAAVVMLLAGFAAAAYVAAPGSGHRLAGFEHTGLAVTAGGIARAVAQPVRHAERFAALPHASLWLWAYFAYLAPCVPLLCFALASFVGIEVFYNLVFSTAAPWHIGNAVLVLIAVLWLDASRSVPTRRLPYPLARSRVWLGRALSAAVVFLFADQVVLAYHDLALDVRSDYSANRSLAALLRSDPALADAVVTGEPDQPLWSLPYYADHRIYLPREGVFRPFGQFGPALARDYDLASLLATARRLRADCACPVVITLGWQLGTLGTFANAPGTHAEEHFTITAAARDDFQTSTTHLARLGPTITDENYDVYLLR
jgi:hypothetical protein